MMNLMRVAALSILLATVLSATAKSQMCGFVGHYDVAGSKVAFRSSHASPTDAQIPNPDVGVENPDVGSFKPLYEGAETACGSAYAQDKNHIYYLGRILTNDVAHFKFSQAKNKTVTLIYAEDSSHIYVQSHALPKEGFQLLDGYIKTSAAIFDLSGQRLEADPSTFEVLGCNVTRDKTAIYMDDKRIHEVNLAKFGRATNQDPKTCFFTDEAHVYWAGAWCVGGCSQRLVRINRIREKKNNKLISVEPATFFQYIDAREFRPQTWNSTPID